ncbi:MAG: hypothetical protein Q9183_006942 [Haloplaca sp. 2 TL-2023]
MRTYLKNYTFCSGDITQDAATKSKILQLADKAAAQPPIFDESIMFQDPHDSGLKEDFRNRFRNVSRLMDCVGCDKCRLWGKLQTVGYGTALKVLFEYEEDKNGENPLLKRTELVALVNTLDRVARSLTSLKEMRDMVEGAVVGAVGASETSPELPKVDTKSSSSPEEGFDHLSSASSPPAPSPVDDDDFGDDDSDPNPRAKPSISQLFMQELSLVFRTLGYVLKSWIDIPSKLFHIAVLEISRLWNFWLGLPVQPREYVWDLGPVVPERRGAARGRSEL